MFFSSAFSTLDIDTPIDFFENIVTPLSLNLLSIIVQLFPHFFTPFLSILLLVCFLLKVRGQPGVGVSNTSFCIILCLLIVDGGHDGCCGGGGVIFGIPFLIVGVGGGHLPCVRVGARPHSL